MNPQPADTLPSSPTLDELLGRADVWQAGAGPRMAAGHEAQPSGHAALDRALTGHGWPRGGLIECALPHPGCGEIALLAPALQQLASTGGVQLWINPPFTPYAPALQQLGLPLSQLVTVRPRTPAEWLWSCELALRSPASAALLCWPMPGRQGQLSYAALRKLQVAAGEGNALFYLFTQAQEAPLAASPAVLRCLLTPVDCGLQLEIRKQRGAAGGQTVQIPLRRAASRRAAQRGQLLLASQPLQAWRQLESKLPSTGEPPAENRHAPLPLWKPS